jgi:hypothetical protein
MSFIDITDNIILITDKGEYIIIDVNSLNSDKYQSNKAIMNSLF